MIIKVLVVVVVKQSINTYLYSAVNAESESEAQVVTSNAGIYGDFLAWSFSYILIILKSFLIQIKIGTIFSVGSFKSYLLVRR